MPYLIDGHNLIPKLGLSLRALDDEEQLIVRLQEFCRQERTRVEVYFDNAPPGQASTKRYGNVTAHFVRQGETADRAIAKRLASLGGEAKNWAVVSSDHEVQATARRFHAHVLSSEAFARRLRSTPGEKDEKPSSLDDVEMWLRLFGEKRE
ncbi:MAG: NYN domain-containing protein [Anaerolineales bacterium]